MSMKKSIKVSMYLCTFLCLIFAVKMSDEKLITFKIKRFDLPSYTETVFKISIKIDSEIGDVQQQLRQVLDVADDVIFKLRVDDDTLVPFSYLFNDDNQLFTLEVNKIHQNTELKARSHLDNVYLEAVKSQVNRMGIRISTLELLISDIRLKREVNCERVVNELMTKVAFLERRLEALTPDEWREQWPQESPTITSLKIA